MVKMNCLVDTGGGQLEPFEKTPEEILKTMEVAEKEIYVLMEDGTYLRYDTLKEIEEDKS